MGWEEIRARTEGCGCVEMYETNDFNQTRTETKLCRTHAEEAQRKYIENERKAQESLQDFSRLVMDLEYERVPIKYLRQMVRSKGRCHSGGYIDLSLLQVTKERNRYYCCKKRVDAFFLHRVNDYWFVHT